MPLQISYGARGVGAAGLGWDVPLSYIQDYRSYAHRRPAPITGAPDLRERTYLSLLGQNAELMFDGNVWVARSGTLELAARQVGSIWLVYDGQGRTYTFRRPAALGVTGLWLLTSVSKAGGSSVVLSYQFTNSPLNGGIGTAIDLVSIAYNQELPNVRIVPGCPKNVITLTYGPETATPLSISVLDDRLLVRRHVLESVNVSSRATCRTASQRLRRYVFQYGQDTDTQLPRLQTVSMFGRQGTPEEHTALPVGAYGYGSATENGDNGPELRYHTTQIDLPLEVQGGEISGTFADDSDWVKPQGDQDKGYAMWQTLIDVTGDGRPDLVFKHQDSNHNDKLFVAYNLPGSDGTTTIGVGGAITELSDSAFSNGGVSAHTLTHTRFAYTISNTDNVWREAIDVNGDGRVDIIDAREEPDHWVVYLNTLGTNGVTWVRRTFSVAKLRTALLTLGHKIDGPYVPLSRRATGVDTKGSECWHWDGSWQVCSGFNNDDVPDPNALETTYVEWDLMDLNGDGYPDFVLNLTPVQLQIPRPRDNPHGVQDQTRHLTNVHHHFKPGDSNDVAVAFNVVGVRFDTDQEAFDRPETLFRYASSGVSAQFGVGMWQECISRTAVNPCTEGAQEEVAGFADVNGDGLLDRVVWQSINSSAAYLGVYSKSAMFAPTYITLPGPLASVIETYKKACTHGSNLPPQSTQTSGLRDLTGDGFPDYYHFDDTPGACTDTNPCGVWIGTGTGFRGPVTVKIDWKLVFSHQTEECGGAFSNTDGGLFDIDGDGKPEIITLGSRVVNGTSISTMVISRLDGGQGPGRPEAGRLTKIDNGYGAQTSINYVSAKQFTDNPVPFPEIVVSSVSTTGTENLGGALAGTLHAYGDGELVFDSVADRFTFPGYGRHVEVRLFGPQETAVTGKPAPSGDAIITDAWPLTQSCNKYGDCEGLTQLERWLRTVQVGRVRDVLMLRGLVNSQDPSLPPNPWGLLYVLENDPRVIGATHYNYKANLYQTPQSPSENIFECMEMLYPLDYQGSIASNSGLNGIDACHSHGFAFVNSTDSWRGDAAPPSDQNVQTRTQMLKVDDFGRPLITEYDNDVFRGDDDICLENTFANPSGAFPRVLSAAASRRFYACGKDVTFARESLAYDGLPAGLVSNGRITSHSVDRHATDTGNVLNSVHRFDATYDAAGNLSTVRTQRQSDGATRTVTYAYDSFGLVPTHKKIDATGLPSIDLFTSFDPISLQTLSSTNMNHVTQGIDYDGFGRPIRATLTPPGNSLGVMSTASYLGFSGSDPDGRRVTVTQFTDPVAPANVATTPGRSSTVFLDELGRSRRIEIALGSDYANQVLVVGSRAYDGAGRVVFEADPYPNNQDRDTAYGTSYHFTDTGDLNCVIRGQGHQPLNLLTDWASERLPTCFQRSFSGHTDTLDIRDAASLLAPSFGFAQTGVVNRVAATAIGRVIERSTLLGGTRLEDATFAYDRLGQLTSITRYLDPASVNLGTQWSFQLDSIGEILQLDEPDSATRYYSYSDWGEPVETQWLDGGIDRRLKRAYDAMGRLIATEEHNNGVIDPETVNMYAYDTGVSVSPMVTPTFVLGQLARATSPGGEVTFSYDAFGLTNAQVFTDHQGGTYVEKAQHHADRSVASLVFQLPDRSYDQELVTYGYDSAGRLRGINFADASETFQLYHADDIDVLGRVRKAVYPGNTILHATYANTGRQLIQQEGIESALGSRQILFGQFDPVGRELSRQEMTDGAASGAQTAISYDALGRVQTARQSDGAATLFDRNFGYDPVGNIIKLADKTSTAGNVLLSDQVNDRDRTCRIDYGLVAPPPGAACNVIHDAVGNVVTEPTRTGSRQLTYFLSGDTRTITEQGAQARFTYDAFGNVQALDIQGMPEQERHDRRYGGLIERRQIPNDPTTSIITRSIPGPAGIVASRRGAGNDWVFEFGERRGSRFFTNPDGAFVQSLDYQPFGEAKSTGASPDTADYTSYQWNGGDALAPFGLYQLGARIYDPVIGRFLSRDPLMALRTATTSNPYAFAVNDPLNAADPTGLDDWTGGCAAPEQCFQAPILPFWPSDAGGASPTAGPATLRPILHPLPEPLFRGGPTTAEGATAYFLALNYHSDELIKGFNFDTYLGTGAGLETLLDSLAQSAPIAIQHDAEVDAHNSLLNTIGSFSAGFGDAVFFWCPGCTANARQSWGITSGDADRWAYFWGSLTGIGGSIAAPSPTTVIKPAPAIAIENAEAGGGETFFRTMSEEHYAELRATGRLPATSETFISPSLEYASKYNGVTVQFNLQAGTTDSLLGMGVRNAGLGGSYGNLPVVQSGWGWSGAFFKQEGNVVNIGLGRGPALDTFNDNIVNFNLVPKP
jgi:RHS repeat-associated protein